jgi:hypothetical protein
MAPNTVEDGPAQAPLVLVEILDRVGKHTSAFESSRLHEPLKVLPREQEIHVETSPCIRRPITASVPAR